MLWMARNPSPFTIVVGVDLSWWEQRLGESAGWFMAVGFGETHAHLEAGGGEDSA